jgi:antagonist of KipI
MGIRLKGPALPRRILTEVISSGVTTGSVQVPAEGQPIILGADRQTVGGYPQIAVVIGPDLPLLAQLVPGDHVSFRRVTLEEAIKIKTLEV